MYCTTCEFCHLYYGHILPGCLATIDGNLQMIELREGVLKPYLDLSGTFLFELEIL
jgi:hypothetical protein